MVLQGDSPSASPVQAGQWFQAQADAAAAWLHHQKHVDVFSTESSTSTGLLMAPEVAAVVPCSSSSALSQLQASTSALSNIAAAASLQLLHPVPTMHSSKSETAAVASAAAAATAVPLSAGSVESSRSDTSVLDAHAALANLLCHGRHTRTSLLEQASQRAALNMQDQPMPETPAVQRVEQSGKQHPLASALVQAQRLEGIGMTEQGQPFGKLPEQPHQVQLSTEQPKSEQPKTKQPQSDNTQEQQPQTEQAHPEQPQLQQPQTEHAQTEQTHPDQPQTQQPEMQQPQTEQRKTEQSQVQQSHTEQPQTEQPQTEQREMQQPQGERPQPQPLQTELAQGKQSHGDCQTTQSQIQQIQTQQPQMHHSEAKQDAHAVPLRCGWQPKHQSFSPGCRNTVC